MNEAPHRPYDDARGNGLGEERAFSDEAPISIPPVVPPSMPPSEPVPERARPLVIASVFGLLLGAVAMDPSLLRGLRGGGVAVPAEAVSPSAEQPSEVHEDAFEAIPVPAAPVVVLWCEVPGAALEATTATSTSADPRARLTCNDEEGSP